MKYTREITDSERIQHILMYVVFCVRKPVKYSVLQEIVMNACNINFMDFQLALSNLTDKGLVRFFMDEDNKPSYESTERMNETINMYKKQIPIYIKDSLDETMKKILDEEFVKDLTKSRVIPVNKGEYAVECKVLDVDGTTLLNVEFYTGDRDMAADISQRFKKDPNTIYEKIMMVLTDEST